jgi:hypothetical protein
MKIRSLGMQLAVVALLGTLTWAQEAPKAEINFDYSWARINPTANYTQWHALNGGGGGIKFNLGEHFGVKADLQGYNSNTTHFTIPITTTFPNGASGTVSGNLFTYLFGPEFKMRFVYFNALVGSAHSSVYANAYHVICSPIVGNCVGSTAGAAPSANALAVAAGIGFGVPLNRRVDLRVGEFGYLYTHFTNVFNSSGQNNFRYLGGLNIKMGVPSPKMPSMACGAQPSEVLPWAGPVTVTATPADFNPKHTLTYGWESSGGTVAGQEASATVNTDQLAPGEYKIRAHATDPKQKTNNTATCTASFKVKQPTPPVVACSASPASVNPGEPITVTVSGSSPDLSAIDHRSFSASSGAFKEGQTQRGTQPGEFTTVATLDTSNAPPGPISMSVGVTDVHGLSSTCTASAEVAAPPVPAPPPPQPTAQNVGKCDFSGARPTRVNNECKAVLDEVGMQLKNEPDSRMVIVGYADSADTVKDVDAIRAVNVRNYLTKGDGKQQIDASRIEIRKATDRNIGKVAQLYVVPRDAKVELNNTEVIDESTLPTKRPGL